MSKSDATLAELQAWLLAEHNVKVSIGCLWKRLRQLGLTLKKSHCAPPSKIAPTSPRPAMNGVILVAQREGRNLGFELFDGQAFEARPLAFGTYSVELQDKDGSRFCVYKHAIK